MHMKNGLDQLESSVNAIETMRSFWRVSFKRLKQGVETKATEAPSPSHIQYNQDSMERVAGSAPTFGGKEKRNRENGELQESSECNLVTL